MYEFHYDYMKRKYDDDKLTLCYMDTDSLVYDIKTDDLYKDIADDVESRFDTSGYVPDRPLPVGLNKKVIGLMKDELGGGIMKEFVTLRPNEPFFRKLCDVVAKESCRLVPKVGGKKSKPEDFDLVKDNRSGRAVYAKIYSRKSGKAKCRISLGSPKNIIPIEELVNESFEGSCIVKLYHTYLGSTKSITLSIEEIFVAKTTTTESYFNESDSEESDDE